VLFNSFPFLFVFLPVVLGGFFVMGRASPRAAAAWLFLASLGFYGWWNPKYVPLLLGSVLANYAFGIAIVRLRQRRQFGLGKAVLALGVCLNLALLGYFKYANFFVATTAALLDQPNPLASIVLPLGISFFTFTQIAFLVDVHRGLAVEPNPIHYGLFVTYFPHLIAGPLLHHKEMMPQFAKPKIYRPNWEMLAVGFTMFGIGLFKKVMLADGIDHAIPSYAFLKADQGQAVAAFEAWADALTYTLRLYFDFSGYSDMALGLSLLFGVRLPLNFDSPYKASSIIDFWRRWHMTLSRFLRDYLYIPLGGNRRGGLRRHLNLFLTMLLGGLWHGAGWTFVIWGALHGLYLIINHVWRLIRPPVLLAPRFDMMLSGALTFLAVVVGWVFFRANTVDGAVSMLQAMIGLNGFALQQADYVQLGPLADWLADRGVRFNNQVHVSIFTAIGWIAPLLAIVWLAPNSQELLANFRPALGTVAGAAHRSSWQPNWAWATAIGLAVVLCILNLNRPSAFLYFQF
jgi:alginate O-acetyltransferase complex protein AlgI